VENMDAMASVSLSSCVVCVSVEAMYNPEMGAVRQNSFVTYIGAGYINVTVQYIVSLFKMFYVNFLLLLHCLSLGVLAQVSIADDVIE
jgi:hypothetical protein